MRTPDYPGRTHLAGAGTDTVSTRTASGRGSGCPRTAISSRLRRMASSALRRASSTLCPCVKHPAMAGIVTVQPWPSSSHSRTTANRRTEAVSWRTWRRCSRPTPGASARPSPLMAGFRCMWTPQARTAGHPLRRLRRLAVLGARCLETAHGTRRRDHAVPPDRPARLRRALRRGARPRSGRERSRPGSLGTRWRRTWGGRGPHYGRKRRAGHASTGAGAHSAPPCARPSRDLPAAPPAPAPPGPSPTRLSPARRPTPAPPGSLRPAAAQRVRQGAPDNG